MVESSSGMKRVPRTNPQQTGADLFGEPFERLMASFPSSGKVFQCHIGKSQFSKLRVACSSQTRRAKFAFFSALVTGLSHHGTVLEHLLQKNYRHMSYVPPLTPSCRTRSTSIWLFANRTSASRNFATIISTVCRGIPIVLSFDPQYTFHKV